MYYVNCTELSCRDNYAGETGRRVVDYSGRDFASHI